MKPTARPFHQWITWKHMLLAICYWVFLGLFFWSSVWRQSCPCPSCWYIRHLQITNREKFFTFSTSEVTLLTQLQGLLKPLLHHKNSWIKYGHNKLTLLKYVGTVLVGQPSDMKQQVLGMSASHTGMWHDFHFTLHLSQCHRNHANNLNNFHQRRLIHHPTIQFFLRWKNKLSSCQEGLQRKESLASDVMSLPLWRLQQKN